MPDNLSKNDRVKTMRAVKSQGTSPERRLRAMLAGMGIHGWQLNYDKVPGKPDIAFPMKQVAIFVDGCFWHQCPECNRPLPETNRDYWKKKISRNVARDHQHNVKLTRMGWTVVRIWEHELKKRLELDPVAKRIQLALEQ